MKQFLTTMLILLCGMGAAQAQVADTVYVFWSVDCPVCRSMVESVDELVKEFRRTAVFVAVVPQIFMDSASMVDFRETYTPDFAIIGDSVRAYQRRFVPGVTPEAFVVHDGKVVYQGRINNLYVSVGRRRQHVTSHEVRDVLRSLRAGRVPPFVRTEPVGCVLGKAN